MKARNSGLSGSFLQDVHANSQDRKFSLSGVPGTRQSFPNIAQKTGSQKSQASMASAHSNSLKSNENMSQELGKEAPGKGSQGWSRKGDKYRTTKDNFSK